MSFVNPSYYRLPPKKLFEMYINPSTHQAITGAPADIGANTGLSILLNNRSNLLLCGIDHSP
jgi:hypothetical protein